MKYSKVLKSGAVFIDGKFHETNIGISGNKIACISSSDLQGEEVISCKGLSIFPGFIDSQVHFREPGLVHKEDIESGSKAAAAGGITAFFEMPNTKPSTSNKEALLHKLAIASKNSYTDFAFYAGATKENISHLDEMRKIPGVSGVKIFMGSSTGNLLISEDKEIEEILRKVRSPIAVHSEDEEMLKERKSVLELDNLVSRHPLWRNEDVAFSSTQRLIRLAQKTGKKVHVLHITSKKEIEYLALQKNYCSLEITPQHLSFFGPDIYEKMGTKAQMNPPIRGKEHLEALWKAINKGYVNVIGSDHAPHTLSEKALSYPNSPSGMPGVETIAPVMLTHALNGKMKLDRLVNMLSSNVCELFGISQLGKIQEDYSANFSIFDLKSSYKMDQRAFHSKCGWSLFDGFESHARPTITMIGGDIVYRDSQLIKTKRKAIVFEHNHR